MKDKLKSWVTKAPLSFQLLQYLLLSLCLTLISLGLGYFFYGDESKSLLLLQKVPLVFMILFIAVLLADYPVKWIFRKSQKRGVMHPVSFGIVMSAFFVTDHIEQLYAYWNEQKWLLLLQETVPIFIITIITSCLFDRWFDRKSQKR